MPRRKKELGVELDVYYIEIYCTFRARKILRKCNTNGDKVWYFCNIYLMYYRLILVYCCACEKCTLRTKLVISFIVPLNTVSIDFHGIVSEVWQAKLE